MAAERVLYIDSYHAGYPWSDGITEGVKSVIEPAGHELKVHYLDTKRNGSTEFKEEAAAKAKALIEEYKPSIVIAADDNAHKYLMAPNYVGSDLPFVFAGVNWDASGYGYPADNVTGMLEVSPTAELVEILKGIAKGEKIGFLAGDNESNRKELENVEAKFGLSMTPVFAKTQDDWIKGYDALQASTDLVVLAVTAGIEGFDDAVVTEHVMKSTKVPTGGYNSSVRSIALINFEKVAAEQGEWAANAALEILGGTKPSDIEIARNTQGYIVINASIAQASGLEIPDEIVAVADEVLE